ncbi:4-alpha-glucanotransferase [Acetobacter sp. LMG 1636]|uniref:4-alpha-glucanotransferase n=2 Tax=Acetobacter fallax TaxID=1737473 RepID=A0ABX0KFU4_9PROT|nr:4-alpha-glucanotransferase [Acetobacter fallax]NHO34016.1 4-alpha-glucanotransferase [Acetobacter fallax]NHO37550.1 4-alpha-glucanotransferase [Acetobacter fallax]
MLIKQAAFAGLKVRWRDARGKARRVSPESLRRLLAVLDSPDGASLPEVMPAMIVTDEGKVTRLPTEGREGLPGIAAETTVRFVLTLENGLKTEGKLKRARDGTLLIPAVKTPGYHQIAIGDQATVLAVAPARCPAVSGFTGRETPRCWGLAAQIYGLRHQGDGGIGHFGAVGELARVSGRAGADALMLSPVHAMFAARPQQYSPYSPSSRLFLNVLLADPHSVFDTMTIRAAMRRARISQNITECLETQDLVDWPTAAKFRLKLLRTLYDSYISHPESGDFTAFVQSGGNSLQNHAVFEALHAKEVQRGPGGGDWRLWPEPIRSPHTPEVERFVCDMAVEIGFHKFLQWIAARSLQSANIESRKGGMKIGLIGDLAVGVDPAGSECWSGQTDHLIGLSIGAPPDALSQAGQNWGLTTYSPRALRTTGYRAFIEILRAGFSHGGGMRIDHVMGIERLWVIPDGGGAEDGAYLTYPRDDMLRLMALEATRANAVVIGEDLGTVEPAFRKAAIQHGLMGMNVLPFQRDTTGAFLASDKWSETSVAMTTTHDLPTIAGWWQGTDIAWREKLGQIRSDNDKEKVQAERERDRTALWTSLQTEPDNTTTVMDYRHPVTARSRKEAADKTVTASVGIQAEPSSSECGAKTVVDRVIRLVAHTDCPMAIVPLEDLLGLAEQPNIPGTISGHPNWRRRYPAATKALLARVSVTRRLATLRAERPRHE